MAGRGAAAFGLAALLAPATPTPTPNASGVPGCHRWKYALHWDRPSRLATLKNALGKSVTNYKSYKAPGGGAQDDWPDPIDHSVDWTGAPNAGAWKYKSPPPAAATTAVYDHDCDDFLKGGPACKAPGPGDPDGEHPGIWYTSGPADHGEIVDWSWTLNYGYAKAPGNDTVYGLDPGPPLPVYDLTVNAVVGHPLGDSIPGITGTPLAFPVTFMTRGGVGITAQTSPGVGGVGQPQWEVLTPADVVGKTASQVNWGLMTYQFPDFSSGCADDASNYHILVPIVSDDSGDVTAIEDYLRLKYYSSGAHPGLGADGGTPTKRALTLAGQSLKSSWDVDPKKKCARPWGVILCTDGLSNICNEGVAPDEEWGFPGIPNDPILDWDPTAPGYPVSGWANPPNLPPCEADVNGADFIHYPPGAAEAIYNLALKDPTDPAAAVIKPRTYAIGISPEVGACELNRVAYRGRSDKSAPSTKGDAGFLLYDPAEVAAGRCTGDPDLPHLDVATGDESGPGPAPSPNHFRQDQTPAKVGDYAFFALDRTAIVDAFTAIVAATGTGDYSTSAPVSGGSLAVGGSFVLLPSTDYPSWTGHFRQVDTSKSVADVAYNRWDAALVLNDPTQPWQPTPDATAGHPGRSIYTWDPVTSNLIPVDTAPGHVAAMAALAGDPAFSANVVDFIRGNDGTLAGVIRAHRNLCDWTGWLLGPIINATPGVVGPPYVYKQAGNVQPHKPYEVLYANRRPLAWVGSNDGMVHAFDFDDGTEILALIPPNLLAQQITLYNQFKSGYDPAATPPHSYYPTGQFKPVDSHIWGVGSSFRFADLWDGAKYKTVGFITEGEGGDLIAAIDITHPYPGRPAVGLSAAIPKDIGYLAAKPVEVLWTKRSVDYANLLFNSWSVPAVAPDSFSTNRMFFGAGINPLSLFNAQVDATLFVVDPSTGGLNVKKTTAATGTPVALIGQQTFADAVFFSTKSSGYLPDNVANLGLQSDTDGRAWFTWGNFAAGTPTTKVGIDLNYAAVPVVLGVQTPIPQPLYYAPSATGQGTTGCQIYGLGSGSLYETSPTVSGWNVNRSGPVPNPLYAGLPPFTPYLYVGVNPYKITDAAFGSVPLGKAALNTYMIKQQIGGEGAGIDLPLGDPSIGPGRAKLGPRTQLTSGPVMVVDNTGKGEEQMLVLLYDPDSGCNGQSYVVVVTFKVAANCGKPTLSSVVSYGAGSGAASGFTLAGEKIFASQSGIGQGQTAGLREVPVPVNILSGAPSFQPVWWRDVK